MKLYQLTAKGPLFYNKQVTFRHSSRAVFLNEEEAAGHLDEFKTMMTTPLDENDIGYLDPENTSVSVAELTIVGQMELPVPEGFAERVMEAIEKAEENDSPENDPVAILLERMDQEDEALTDLPEETLAEVVPITKSRGRRKKTD